MTDARVEQYARLLVESSWTSELGIDCNPGITRYIDAALGLVLDGEVIQENGRWSI